MVKGHSTAHLCPPAGFTAQTFLRFAERAEKHVVAGDWYAAIARRIDELLAFPPERRGDPKDVLERLGKEMNKAKTATRRPVRICGIRWPRAYGVTQPTFGDEARVSVP